MTINELRKQMVLTKKDNKEKAKVYVAVLSLAQLLAKEDRNREVIDKDIIMAAKKELKMAEQSKNSNAPYNPYVFEVLEEFLPKKISIEELTNIIDKIIKDIEKPNIGLIMKELNKIEGIDKKEASIIIKQKLFKD